VVTPLEEMMYRINQISKDPLEARYLEEEFELAEEGNKDTGHHTYECDILKKLIVKTGALLALGFGEAGTQVIKRNLKSSNIDPMIAGVRIVAVFGFCDIRNFTDTTEILQEQVMKFVNEIAQIVHSTVTSFYGSPNKYLVTLNQEHRRCVLTGLEISARLGGTGQVQQHQHPSQTTCQ
jgi:hypothetical protein